MLTFDTDQGRFNVRAAGVCIEDGHLLAQRFEWSETWVLPGGRIEFGEDSAAALTREMREELPIAGDVSIERLLWFTELFFTPAVDDSFHELAFYYLIALPHGHALGDKSAATHGQDGGSRFQLRWLPLERLDSYPIVPYFLRTALLALPSTPEHLICYEDR